jgi:aminoglycoside 6'-N-acetyltransferase I
MKSKRDDLGISVRPVTRADEASWLNMRDELWPGSRDDHAREIARFLDGRSREPLAVLIAEDGNGRALGFAELSIHPYAEGCTTDRVGYLEGWYVAPEARRRGIGRALLAASEDWARAQGCSEFASDAEADNQVSHAAHLALGFTDRGLIRVFSKTL